MEITLGNYSVPFAPWRPADGRVFEMYAFDTETTLIDDERPYLTRPSAPGAACAASRVVFVPRDNVVPFFEAHRGVPFICHNAAFDLRVTDVLLKPTLDLYEAVEHGRVWDTEILKRLHSLA